MRFHIAPEDIGPVTERHFDPGALFAVLELQAARKAERLAAIPAPPPAFPNIRAYEGQWVRQNLPGGAWWPIPAAELSELLGMEAA